jgi:transposase
MMRSRVVELRAELTVKRQAFRGFVEKVSREMASQSEDIKRTFDSFAQDFLVERCQLGRAPKKARVWHFVVDNLDIHRSESLVRFVATDAGLKMDLGKKSKRGILQSRQTRAAFLSDSSHRLVYTPKHASWMNQVEIWLSILVRKLLRRGSFPSIEELVSKVHEFIAYYNRTMAKPFKWTYQGKALMA